MTEHHWAEPPAYNERVFVDAVDAVLNETRAMLIRQYRALGRIGRAPETVEAQVLHLRRHLDDHILGQLVRQHPGEGDSGLHALCYLVLLRAGATAATRDQHRDAIPPPLPETPSERCRRTQVQTCHACEDLTCGDNRTGRAPPVPFEDICDACTDRAACGRTPAHRLRCRLALEAGHHRIHARPADDAGLADEHATEAAFRPLPDKETPHVR